ncbi:globin domain-containing protein [Rhodovulum marinum]|uniref:Hemoglobin-like flavoprotein n=1 Tax=Rhodovulum marinum TaxID=320662 RepID=A0A4R2PSC0_9RHOB|nr:globin domain-containing protein [Rhodovulum marinum]TCP38677.1 hemoglobin-like flavoprotein [Rhodovulum marinum]
MEARARKIVVESAGPIFAAKGRFADFFYQHLFDLAPETRALFRRDLHRQKRMLMAALAMVVGVLGDRDRLAATAAHLGRVHANRRVRHAHMMLGQRAFDLALADFYGPACTDEMRIAWQSAYAQVLEMMEIAPDPCALAETGTA